VWRGRQAATSGDTSTLKLVWATHTVSLYPSQAAEILQFFKTTLK